MLVLRPRGLPLPLLQTGILLVDDVPFATANHDLAILGTSLDAASNFHGGLSRVERVRFVYREEQLPRRNTLATCLPRRSGTCRSSGSSFGRRAEDRLDSVLLPHEDAAPCGSGAQELTANMTRHKRLVRLEARRAL